MSEYTIDEIRKHIRILQWTIETKIPADLAATNHARRIASLKRQRTEAEESLRRLVIELGSRIQEENR